MTLTNFDVDPGNPSDPGPGEEPMLELTLDWADCLEERLAASQFRR